MMPTVESSAGDWLEVTPWRDRAILLIYVPLAGDAYQSHRLGEKREIIQLTEGRIMAVWNGT